MTKGRLKLVAKLVFAIAIGYLLIFVGLVFWADYIKDKCYQIVDNRTDINPNELLTNLDEAEKEKLGMDKDLIPGRRYYEMKKCVYERYVLK